ncbi:MAG: hypothetical protein RL368_657 [Pseudomonadota bacterium]|jgi:hypothetical protein
MKLQTFLYALSPSDKLILICACVAVVWSYQHYWHWHEEVAEYALIFVDQQVPFKVSLREDRLVRVNGHLGESLLQVEAGKIRFIASPCQGKQCIHAGWLHEDGDFAACLPNHVSVELQGEHAHFDSIVY